LSLEEQGRELNMVEAVAQEDFAQTHLQFQVEQITQLQLAQVAQGQQELAVELLALVQMV
jgi:hypothetical protein